ncbi:glutathionylspermidine synthase family protein [Bacillus sp. FJAT-47783]|uniref:glutathionylspermidine synthase family protein n=1 Tax=Bacillus sp. FJAT-47783 TaxID=2922712 RepID=UPI001FABA944|nr:glutathionylspermidine synthase family protein [Bacillus sp. FJAT-47783]
MVGDRHSFRQKRIETYRQIDQFWPDLYDSEYALLDIILFNEKEIEEIRLATNRVAHIFHKTAKLLRKADDETLMMLDIPREMLPFIRHRFLPVETVIARCDFVQTKSGYKLLELNADTPTFIKEVFHVNEYLTDYFHAKNPNVGVEKHLALAVRKAIIESAIKLNKEEPYIVFTSHHDHEEDKFTSLYLLEISGLDATYVPLQQLNIVSGEGLYDQKGRKIDILYRQTYPLEHLILDEDPITKEKVGIQLLELVTNHQLAMINPISAFLLQSKAVQAVIWGLFEQHHPYFTEEEHQWIYTYFLPTYLDDNFFTEKGIPYVKKPSFGREGDTVEIYLNDGTVMEDPNKTYKDSIPVFQQYVELPTYEIETIEGKKRSNYLIGSFLINGEASGIGVRAGGPITDNGAYYLPIGVRTI